MIYRSLSLDELERIAYQEPENAAVRDVLIARLEDRVYELEINVAECEDTSYA